MKKRATEAKMGELHELTATVLIAKLQSGDCEAADINAAIKFLSNNGIEVETTPTNPMGKMLASLPTFDDEEEAHTKQ